MIEIIKSGKLCASQKGLYGPGVYVTALHPSNRAKSQVLANNYGWTQSTILGTGSSSSSSAAAAGGTGASGTGGNSQNSQNSQAGYTNNVAGGLARGCDYAIELDAKAIEAEGYTIVRKSGQNGGA